MNYVDADQRTAEKFDREPAGQRSIGAVDGETTHLLRNHWVGITIITLACTIGVLIWSLLQPKVYEATATGIVVAVGEGDLSGGMSGSELARTQAASYWSLALAEPVTSAVINDLGLETTTGELVKHVVVETPASTPEVHITADAESPEMAAAIADAWIGALAAQVDVIEGVGTTPDETTPRVTLQPLSDASPQMDPASPMVGLNTALGLLVGLGLGLTYAFFRHRAERVRAFRF